MSKVLLAPLSRSTTRGNGEAVEVESEALSLEGTESARGKFVLWVRGRGVWVGFRVGDRSGDTRSVLTMGFEVVTRLAKRRGRRMIVSRVSMCEPGRATGGTGKGDCSSSHGDVGVWAASQTLCFRQVCARIARSPGSWVQLIGNLQAVGGMRSR